MKLFIIDEIKSAVVGNKPAVNEFIPVVVDEFMPIIDCYPNFKHHHDSTCYSGYDTVCNPCNKVILNVLPETRYLGHLECFY